MGDEVKERPYDNEGRRIQSGETKQRIVEAARDLIVERGYRATTVAQIAVRAGVHVDTVYALVGRKPLMLRELIEQAISGTDRAVAAQDRDYVKAMGAASDPVRKLTIYARAMREIQVRMAPLMLALRDASATEPEAMKVWREISDRRAANMRLLVGDLDAAGGLRAGLSVDEAADVIWATNSSELYVLLTVERGWPPDRYERWLADAWCRLLLPGSAS
ncbi:MAG: TetR/AcrR family transcriptional regulator [Actinomycetota bacterium]|nr:TetR/AcrR family transcriptional regulator [Actinomycetota bacterium]